MYIIHTDIYIYIYIYIVYHDTSVSGQWAGGWPLRLSGGCLFDWEAELEDAMHNLMRVLMEAQEEERGEGTIIEVVEVVVYRGLTRY